MPIRPPPCEYSPPEIGCQVTLGHELSCILKPGSYPRRSLKSAIKETAAECRIIEVNDREEFVDPIWPDAVLLKIIYHTKT